MEHCYKIDIAAIIQQNNLHHFSCFVANVEQTDTSRQSCLYIQVKAAKSLTVLVKDLGTSLEPDWLLEGNTVLGQQLGGEASQGSKHGPPGVNHLNLPVPEHTTHNVLSFAYRVARGTGRANENGCVSCRNTCTSKLCAVVHAQVSALQPREGFQHLAVISLALRCNWST